MYREFGYHPFPLPAGKKAPPPTGWQELAAQGCAVPVESNVGVSTDNFCIVDADSKEVARRIFQTFRSSITVVVETKKGAHFWFAGKIRNSQNALQRKDTRGVGGYAVVPPSVADGHQYTFVRGHELVPVDQLKLIPEELIPPTQQTEAQPINESDPIRRIRRAQAWIERRPPAVSGQAGHKQFFKVCCGLFQFYGLSLSEAMPIILTYNARCLPPFNDKEVMHKLTDALAKSTKYPN